MRHRRLNREESYYRLYRDLVATATRTSCARATPRPTIQAYGTPMRRPETTATADRTPNRGRLDIRRLTPAPRARSASAPLTEPSRRPRATAAPARTLPAIDSTTSASAAATTHPTTTLPVSPFTSTA